ncbi:hypothetical protein NQ314_001665 [Rhamnusium bicolor]|uniref:DUF4371 domain-containing protein n=1 Tax=Rhamnusium bicolor TaxID=1586634 RepID=A0AAV8ZUT8_9CUCU|nr:hypothetical protein NQ314_001665 [Rhamnusium bicolor]
MYEYHKNTASRAEHSVWVVSGKISDVASLVDSKQKRQTKENREKFKYIVETILLSGHQALALKGTNDAGSVDLEESNRNDGNYRALLRYRAQSGDFVLPNHVKSQSSNPRTMYTSATIQNEIIELCGDVIQESIITGIKKWGYFSVLVGET